LSGGRPIHQHRGRLGSQSDSISADPGGIDLGLGGSRHMTDLPNSTSDTEVLDS